MDLPPNSEVKLSPDLEAARDEKCVPVAREILAEMVNSLLVIDPNDAKAYDGLKLFILTRALATDMNITMEAQYLFQLLISAFSGLNTTMHELELTPVDDARYIRIGKQILQILSDANVGLTKSSPESVKTDFADVKVKLQALVVEEKLNALDVRYLMDNIFESVKTINNDTSEALAKSTAQAEAKLFGYSSLDEMTVKKVHEILTNDVSVLFSEKKNVPPEGQVMPPAGGSSVAPPEGENEGPDQDIGGGAPVPVA